MFIFRQLVFITSPVYISISIAAVGNIIENNKYHHNKIFKTLKLMDEQKANERSPLYVVANTTKHVTQLDRQSDSVRTGQAQQ